MVYVLASKPAIRGVYQGIFERKEIYSIPTVLAKRANALSKGLRHAYFDGDRIKIDSQRLLLFAEKGWTCSCCGLKGKYFAKERHYSIKQEGASVRYSGKWNLYLYAVNEQGEEVLMTRDHIKPRSRGGRNVLSNYSTLCTRCNNLKGNKEVFNHE